jgi:hypothetical protein
LPAVRRGNRHARFTELPMRQLTASGAPLLGGVHNSSHLHAEHGLRQRAGRALHVIAVHTKKELTTKANGVRFASSDPILK